MGSKSDWPSLEGLIFVSLRPVLCTQANFWPSQERVVRPFKNKIKYEETEEDTLILTLALWMHGHNIHIYVQTEP